MNRINCQWIPSDQQVDITCTDLPSTDSYDHVKKESNYGAAQEQLLEGFKLLIIHTLRNDEDCSSDKRNS